MKQLNEITSLAIEGGGMLGFAYIEFFRTIEKEHPNFLINIKQFSGSSAGALFAAFLAMQMNLDDIDNISNDVPRLDVTNNPLVPQIIQPLVAFLNFITEYGMYSTNTYEIYLRNTFYLDGKDTLFKDLKKRLVITATNLNSHNIVLFSNELTPDVPLYKAVLASMCIPIVFTPIRYDFNPDYKHPQHLLVDGGTLMNLPIKVFDHPDNPYMGIISDTCNPHVLGVRLDTPEDLAFINGTANKPIYNIISFVTELLDTLTYNCKYDIRDDARTCNIIVKRYKSDDVLTLTAEKKSDLSNAGRDAAIKLLQSLAI